MRELDLNEVSIRNLFIDGAECTFEVPIYQRNYAWGKDEIEALINDIYDSYKNDKGAYYYIGTLVTYLHDDNVYEVIDGQQRLTTIRIILSVLNEKIKNKLKYRARKKSDKTIENLNNLDSIEEKDFGIAEGLKYAKTAIDSIGNERDKFKEYFLNQVHIIHYRVPRDIDLNHYFEVMNSRGEQLEKHEIVKAQLMQKLDTDYERKLFNKIWEACSIMSVYIQQCFEIAPENVFDNEKFKLKRFDSLKMKETDENESKSIDNSKSIANIIGSSEIDKTVDYKGTKDSFQPIIDFPNFLLIVLKITRMGEKDFVPTDFNLDDKYLLDEFRNARFDSEKTKIFAYNLLKSKFFLDNYVVHHSNEDDSYEYNPWELQYLKKDSQNTYILDNLCENQDAQNKLVHLLSMFEVSFTARQRKNYLFYILCYLLNNDADNASYLNFIDNLSDMYFYNIYLDAYKLNEINTPKPGSFDETILNGKYFNEEVCQKTPANFEAIYGNGSEKTKGIPLFVFNYMDLKIWDLYTHQLRGNNKSKAARIQFFSALGCSDFGLDILNKFYFSRTRRSLEHYYPQAFVEKFGVLSEAQINCFGNFAMISSTANSSGSDWTPKAKLIRYLDLSNKISRIGVASLKFWIMMQMCKDNDEWDFESIKLHQEKMLNILFDRQW